MPTTTAMPPVPRVTEADILQFLAAARETIAAVPICWLATRSLEGGTNARAVNSSAGSPGSDEWTRRFLVRRSSRKVLEMQAAPAVTLAYQQPSGERYVALGGRATIIEDVAEMRTMWRSELDADFRERMTRWQSGSMASCQTAPSTSSHSPASFFLGTPL